MPDRLHEITERLRAALRNRTAELLPRFPESDSADAPNAQRTLSNTDLLLETLTAFYRDARSEYFPVTISAWVRDAIVQAEATLTSFLPGGDPLPQDASTTFLRHL